MNRIQVNYKHIIIITLFSLIFGCSIALFHCGRIIIDLPPIFKKSPINQQQSNPIKKASLIWINIDGSKSIENFEIKIKDKISTITELTKNWIKFMQQEHGINITFNYVATGKNSVIIDIKNNSKHATDQSNIQTWNFLESIKFTINSVFPDIKNTYVYEKGKPYKTTFFNYDSINQTDFIINQEQQEIKNENRPYLLIPLFFSRDGKDLGICFEKGFFQKIAQQNDNVLIIHEPTFSNEWIKKISKIKSCKIIFVHIIPNQQTNKIALIENQESKDILKMKYPNIISNSTNSFNVDFENQIKSFCIDHEFIFDIINIPSYAIYYANESACLIECFVKDEDHLKALYNLFIEMIN